MSVLFREVNPKILVLRNGDFLSKPPGLVHHHAESVYIIAEQSSAYIITPAGCV